MKIRLLPYGVPGAILVLLLAVLWQGLPSGSYEIPYPLRDIVG